jgi:hypothetical protein
VQNTRLLIGVAALAISLGLPGRVDAADRPPADGADPVRQVRVLTAALVAAAGENDALRARLDGKGLASAPAGLGDVRFLEGGARVLDVNRDLGMVVLDAGGRQGVRAGMVLMILRNDRPLARVRVVDVRRRVAGAVVEELLSGSPYPGPGDRLVVVTDGD